MLDFLRKHTVVIMAAMALVFVGLMFIGSDVQGGSLGSLFKKAYVSVDGRAYGDKDYAKMGVQGLSTAHSLPYSFGSLVSEFFVNPTSTTELEIINSIYSRLKTNNHYAAFLAYRGIIRREAARLGLTPSQEEVDAAIKLMPEFANDKGEFDVAKYQDFITMRGDMAVKNQEELLRGLMEDTISLARIKQVLGAQVTVDPDFAQAVTESTFQQVTVNTAFLNKQAYRPQTDPGEDEIKAFWEKFKENYKNEEARFATVYTFTPVGDATTGADGKASNATIETINLVEDKVNPALETVNARNMDKVIDDVLAANPGICKVEKKHFNLVMRSNAPQELTLPINKSESDGRSNTLVDVIYLNNTAPQLAMDADEKTIEDARATAGMKQISTTQILMNGQVVLVRVDGITPVMPLPYELARSSARADLIDSMTVEALNKAATDLKAEVEKSAQPLEQFNAIAGKYGAKVATYGPLANPAMPTETAPAAPKDLPEAAKVYRQSTLINPGKVTPAIDTGDGLMLIQLVKREVEDTPQLRAISSGSMVDYLSAQSSYMLRLDWLKACIDRYNVTVYPIVNQMN